MVRVDGVDGVLRLPKGCDDDPRRVVAYQRRVIFSELGRQYWPPSKAFRADGKIRAAIESNKTTDELGSWGIRMVDATSLRISCPEAVSGPTVAFEVKPKACDRVRSWLVSEKHEKLKIQYSRLQIARAARKNRRIDADHELLWSTRAHEVDRGLRSLLARSNERNHLWRLFVDGQPSSKDVDDLTRAVVARVLTMEPLLRNLKKAQAKHDFLDVDGAIRIYNNLELYGKRCQFRQYTNHIETACRAPPGAFAAASPEERSERRRRATRVVDGLSKRQAIKALNRWLLSLALDDLSILVSFRVAQNPELKERLQTTRRAGLCKANDTFVAYAVSIVDIGPKPFEKIASKARTESRLCEDAILVLSSNEQM